MFIPFSAYGVKPVPFCGTGFPPKLGKRTAKCSAAEDFQMFSRMKAMLSATAALGSATPWTAGEKGSKESGPA